MMKSYDLLEAIGNVDDECIKNARAGSNKKIRAAIVSVAACLIFAIVIPLAVNLWYLDNAANSPPLSSDSQDSDKIYKCGTPVTSDRGTITMTEYDIEKKTVTFIFDKVNDKQYGFSFDGFVNDADIVYNAYTVYDHPDLKPHPENAIIKYEGLSCIVNGKKTENLPFAPGYYEIVIDYSGMFEYCDEVSSKFLVIGFGLFIFGDYETVVK